MCLPKEALARMQPVVGRSTPRHHGTGREPQVPPGTPASGNIPAAFPKLICTLLLCHSPKLGLTASHGTACARETGNQTWKSENATLLHLIAVCD